VRHLEVDRDEAFLSSMEKFIKSVMGNDYNISVKKLFFRKKSIGKGAGQDTNLEDRAFFCSELIAKAYKECGLLNTVEASS